MSLGRPAMRRGEERKLLEMLKTHKRLMDNYITLLGISPVEASKQAMRDIQLLAMANKRARKSR